MIKNRYVLGVDYGTDSCRAIILDTADGKTVAVASCNYPRWMKGMYCDPLSDRYRQHPQDYIDAFESVVRDIVSAVGPETAECIEGISFDTTASTPVLVNESGVPLSLLPEFSDEPDAMFVLWKDHTSIAEADEINELAHNWHTDYTAFSGGIYSPEWGWSKILHLLRVNPTVASASYSWMEHCDWMTAWLTGCTKPETVFRSRCAAGHKAMWRAEWGGLPSEEFLAKLDPKLAEMRKTFSSDTYTSDFCAGIIDVELAQKLGLPETVKVGVGAIDAHVGAVGASISEDVLTRIMGTSTCDILVSSHKNVGERKVKGICGQVDGSVIPGLIGFEAGQAAFGDIYAWFRRLLMWPFETFIPDDAEKFKDKILPALEQKASMIPPSQSSLVALDWMNGRRTPDSDQRVKGAITGISLATDAPMIYKALIEATAFGTKAIVERFRSEGVNISSVRAIGGISYKSKLVMQIMSDVIGMPVTVVDCNQCCALGAGMLASVACGIHPTVEAAQKVMGAPEKCTYIPDMERKAIYDKLYSEYKALGSFVSLR